MEFGIKIVLYNERRDKKVAGEIELLDHESIRTVGEKENYRYLGVLEADIIK